MAEGLWREAMVDELWQGGYMVKKGDGIRIWWGGDNGGV
jgi:hypothetical protein